MGSDITTTALRFSGVTCILLVACNALTGVSSLGVDEGADGSTTTSPSPSPTTTGTTSLTGDGSTTPTPDGTSPKADVVTTPDGGGNPIDANVIPDVVIVPDSPPPPINKRVFVTSITTTGSLGDFGGADNLCAARANAAGLGGSWVAWLSAGKNNQHAINRLPDAGGPWHLVTGELVASRAALTSGQLSHAIDRDEAKLAVAASTTVWTGTGTSGRYLEHACGHWTDATENGRFGTAGSTTASWTTAGDGPCNTARRLYCFER